MSQPEFGPQTRARGGPGAVLLPAIVAVMLVLSPAGCSDGVASGGSGGGSGGGGVIGPGDGGTGGGGTGGGGTGGGGTGGGGTGGGGTGGGGADGGSGGGSGGGGGGGGPALPRFASIVAGGDHTCGIAADGRVLCFGSNRYAELGGGGTAQARRASAVPVEVPGLAATSLVAGDSHTCAISSGGSVRCWGSNRFGQVGSGGPLTAPIVASPVPVALPLPAARLTLGAFNTCAELASGAAWCWGDNENAQIAPEGEFDRSTPTELVHVGAVASLSFGMQHACGKQTDGGAPRCWGAAAWGGTPAAPAIGPVDQLSAGTSATCAVAAGKVVCWGMWYLDDGNAGRLAGPVSGITAAVDVATGLSHACALISGGTVRCWGYNRYGQLGDGTTTSSVDPRDVLGLTDAVGLSAGNLHTCALRAGGTVACWGRNRWGQLGDGTDVDRRVPTPVVASHPGPAPSFTPPPPPAGKRPGVGFILAPGTLSRFDCPSGGSLCSHLVDLEADPGQMPGITPTTWNEASPEAQLARRKRWGTRSRTAQGHWAELFGINQVSLENAFDAGLLGSPVDYDGKATLVEQHDSAYTIPRHSAWHCQHWWAHMTGGSAQLPLPVSDPTRPAGPYSQQCEIWKQCTCYYLNTP